MRAHPDAVRGRGRALGRGRARAGDGRALVEGAGTRAVADLVMKAWAPAASIFKLVTATALVERGVSPDTRVCYHDGVHSVDRGSRTCAPIRALDRTCNSFAFALAKSQNAIIAGRLAHDHLDCQRWRSSVWRTRSASARRCRSRCRSSRRTAKVPAIGGLPFARTAAGFWNTTLSPLHGALLAATLAWARWRDAAVDVSSIASSIAKRQRMEQRPGGGARAARGRRSGGARQGRTHDGHGHDRFGTARLGLFPRRGTNRPLLPGIAVAGKTGSLDRPE